MRIFLIILATFLTISVTYPKCSSSGLYFWPTGRMINQNSIFSIEGYYSSQDIIKGLGKKYEIYLKSNDQKIKLEVQEIFMGEKNLTQAVLKPQKKLIPGQEYELIIENIPEKDKLMQRYNKKNGKWEKIIWTVARDIDTEPPNWREKPKEKDKEYAELGCGPVIYVNFSCIIVDKSEYFIKTTVKNLSTGKQTTYCLISDTSGIIAIGHGMCSGAFALENGKKFEVEFTIVDASGNYTNWTGDRLKFKKPTLKNEHTIQ